MCAKQEVQPVQFGVSRRSVRRGRYYISNIFLNTQRFIYTESVENWTVIVYSGHACMGVRMLAAGEGASHHANRAWRGGLCK